MTPVVPKSLTQPVPASQARSRLQEQIDASRARVERLSARGKRQLVRQLLVLEGELRDRLDGLRRLGREDTWTAADTEATLIQVRELLGRQGEAFRELLGANAAAARRLGVENTVDVLRHFEGRIGGPVRPLALDVALAAGSPLLARHEVSVARWGQRTIGRVAGEIQRGLLAGETFDEIKKRLTSERGGVLVASAGDAARIVRTEAMQAYNAGAHEEALAQRASRFPDLQKKLVETFDARTAEDSRAAHGEVRELEAMFVDGKGRHYLHPPGRPNDRGVEIPWRREWENDQGSGEPRTQPQAPQISPAQEQTSDTGYMARPAGAEPVPPGHAAAYNKPEAVGSAPIPASTLPVHETHYTGEVFSTLKIKKPAGGSTEIDQAKTDRVLSVLGEAGLLPFLEKNKLGSIEIGHETWVRTNPDNPKQVESGFNGRYYRGNVWANAGERIKGTPGMGGIGQGWAPQPPATTPHLRPENFSSTAASKEEAGRRVLIHEMGHHIVRVGNGGNSLVEGPAARLIEGYFKRPDKNPLTQYGDDDAHEYFSECFTMYVYARKDLQKNDPVGFQMVVEVLQLPSIGLLP